MDSGQEVQPAVSGPDSSGEIAPETSAVTQPTSANNVELLDAGEAPQVELRLQLEEGEQTGKITQRQTISQSGIDGGITQPISLAYVMQMSATITKDGDNFVTSSQISDVVAEDENDPLTAKVIPGIKEQVVGVETSVTLDPTGQIVEEAQVSGDENLDPQIAQVLDQVNNAGLAAPLPTEAVGVGGTWKVTQNIELSGVKVKQETTFEIISIDGDIVTMDSVATQTVEEGAAIEAGGPALPVKLWESNTTGTMQLDLTNVFPTSAAESKAKQVFETPEGDLTQEIEVFAGIDPT